MQVGHESIEVQYCWFDSLTAAKSEQFTGQLHTLVGCFPDIFDLTKDPAIFIHTTQREQNESRDHREGRLKVVGNLPCKFRQRFQLLSLAGLFF